MHLIWKLFCLSFITISKANKSEEILDQLFDRDDARYPTFKAALDIATERGFKTIVETGTARHGEGNCGGDGCSTVIWSKFAAGTDVTVDSVDICPDAVFKSRMSVEEYGCTAVHLGDSIGFLRNYPKQIDLLYLDSFDYEFGNPLPSQEHHLYEIFAAHNKLHDKSIVLLDDCDLPEGGKCRLVSLHLRKMGWQLLLSGYQMLFVKQL